MTLAIDFRVPWFSSHDSWASAMRNYARAMERAGLRVWLSEPAVRHADGRVLREVGHMRTPVIPDVTILSRTLLISTTPTDSAMDLRVRAERSPHPLVLYTVFETNSVDAEMVAVLNQHFDGVWVPCKANRDAMLASGVRPELVFVAPHCYHDDDPLLKLEPRVRFPHEPAHLLWIGRWEPRKAPHNLIRAFLRAFRPGRALLALKTFVTANLRYRYPPIDDVLTDEIRSSSWSLAAARKAIRVIDGVVPRSEVIALHAWGDVYVSASRGEGFELGGFEAKLAGRRVVTTDCGGPRDYVGEGDVLVPSTGTVEANGHYRYAPGSRWIDYSVDTLATAMRAAASAPAPPRSDMSRFRAEVVGAQLRGWFEGLVETRRAA